MAKPHQSTGAISSKQSIVAPACGGQLQLFAVLSAWLEWLFRLNTLEKLFVYIRFLFIDAVFGWHRKTFLAGQGIANLQFTRTERQLSSSLNYFVLKTLQVRVRTTPPHVLSLVKKIETSI